MKATRAFSESGKLTVLLGDRIVGIDGRYVTVSSLFRPKPVLSEKRPSVVQPVFTTGLKFDSRYN